MSRWVLEYDSDNEIYTESIVDESAIERDLKLFDGDQTFYCALSDSEDDSCLWCIGEPDRRVIEGRLFPGGSLFHFVLAARDSNDHDRVAIKYGQYPPESVEVEGSEILTATAAIDVFQKFYRTKMIHPDFVPVTKAYVFGSLSFGE